ncbi:MAG TPA: hypothetical protein VNY83_04905 [Solirubrobacterales bacterium]|nr:hypothetical protein [Solirubrobacterales bacterium]
MIGAAEIDAIAEWIDRRQGREVQAVEDWFLARQVEEGAVLHQARRYYGAATWSVVDGTNVQTAFEALFVLGFQIGVDAERRRRDAKELPS